MIIILLWTIAGLGVGFCAGYLCCYFEFKRLAVKLKSEKEVKVKRTRKPRVKSSAPSAIGFFDGEDDGAVVM